MLVLGEVGTGSVNGIRKSNTWGEGLTVTFGGEKRFSGGMKKGFCG